VPGDIAFGTSQKDAGSQSDSLIIGVVEKGRGSDWPGEDSR
jgi:hypothetical protein